MEFGKTGVPERIVSLMSKIALFKSERFMSKLRFKQWSYSNEI
jgi:hypothetical protein